MAFFAAIPPSSSPLSLAPFFNTRIFRIDRSGGDGDEQEEEEEEEEEEEGGVGGDLQQKQRPSCVVRDPLLYSRAHAHTTAARWGR